MNARERQRFAADVIAGLSAEKKEIPCKYLYDQRGSELFEEICQTDDYYVTRADLALHEAHLAEIVACIGPEAHILEFGSGAGIKIRKLLAAADAPRAYTPIEISAAALRASARELEQAFPHLEIRPLKADYTQPIPEETLVLDPPARRRVVYFPGSTISNFDHDQARDFLERMRHIAGAGGGILIGVDLLKDAATLQAAYDDSQGVTAAFNRNLLERMQRDLGADVEVYAFRHEARFNPRFRRMEMHLVAERDTAITVDGQRFSIGTGESIHTESSHKYSTGDFRKLAAGANLAVKKTWKDPQGLFSMHYLEAQ